MSEDGSASPQFPNEQNEDGEFVRQEDAFAQWVRAASDTAEGEFPAEAGRYHLYVSLACPWAHRTIIMRKLKGLEDAVGMTVVDPIRDDETGWKFSDEPEHGLGPDPLHGWRYLREAYEASLPGYSSRVTVPVLWDKETNRIVSNNEDHIMRMLNDEFAEFATTDYDAYPPDFRCEIDELDELIYPNINDGVYRTGFATSQAAYEKHLRPLFRTLDLLNERLTWQRYLSKGSGQPTEADWKLFCTLVRFDPVYVGHFKCNIRRIVDYPALWGYLRDLYQYPGIAETVNIDHIKRHYYYTHDEINPTRIVPVGPAIDFDEPPGRDDLG